MRLFYHHFKGNIVKIGANLAGPVNPQGLGIKATSSFQSSILRIPRSVIIMQIIMQNSGPDYEP